MPHNKIPTAFFISFPPFWIFTPGLPVVAHHTKTRARGAPRMIPGEHRSPSFPSAEGVGQPQTNRQTRQSEFRLKPVKTKEADAVR
jgi:hypothetical protein